MIFIVITRHEDGQVLSEHFWYLPLLFSGDSNEIF